MANGVELATAYISLTVDTSKVKGQIKSALGSSSNVGKDVGRKVGSDMAASMQRAIGAMPWVKRSMENAANGAGTTAGTRFANEMRGAAMKGAAATGTAVGRTMAVGVTTGLATYRFSGAVFSRLEAAGKAASVRMATAMGNTIKSTLKLSVGAIGLGGAGFFGSALMGGLERESDIQSATVQLEGLKRSVKELKNLDVPALRREIEAVVTGTPAGLADAMNAASITLGAGLKNAGQVKQAVTDIADAWAAAGKGADFNNISRIWGQIIGRGAVKWEEIQQLEDNNVRAISALTSYMGVDTKTMQKMAEKDQISLDTFSKAIQQSMGGRARAMGQTFEGAKSNFGLGMKKLGSSFISALFGSADDPNDPLRGITDGINKANELLKAMSAIITANRDRIKGFAQTVGDGVKKAFGWVVQNKDGIKQFFTDVGEKVKALGNWLVEHKDDFKTFFNSAKDVALTVGAAIGKVIDFLADHEGLVKAIPAAYVGWKAVSIASGPIGMLVKTLRTVADLLKFDIPDGAKRAGKAITDEAVDATAVVPGGGGKRDKNKRRKPRGVFPVNPLDVFLPGGKGKPGVVGRSTRAATSVMGGLWGGVKGVGRFAKGALGFVGKRLIPGVGLAWTAYEAYNWLKNSDSGKRVTAAVTKWTKETFTKENAGKVWDAGKQKASELAAAGGEWVKKTFTAENMNKFWDGAKKKASEFAQWAAPKIKSALTGLWNWLKDAGAAAWGVVRQKAVDIFNSAVDKIKTKASEMWESIKASVKAKFTEAVEALKTKTSELWEGLKTTISDGFTGMVTTVKGKWDELVSNAQKGFDNWFGPDSTFGKWVTRVTDMVQRVKESLGIGEATANAGAVTDTNRGPAAPGSGPTSRTGSREPGWGGASAMPGRAVVSGRETTIPWDGTITAQSNEVNCGPGATQIVLNGKGVIEGETTLAAEMGTNSSGTGFGGGNISGALNRRLPGANYTETQGASVSTDQFFSEIASSVKAGYGAVLNYNTDAGGPKPVGIKGTTATQYNGAIAHYVAVMGVDEESKSLLIGDSAGGGNSYWISAENAAELMKRRGYVAAKPYATGGHISGPGTGTSDDIPAWLSNGEHVLTASDVKKMGGQGGVYAFRAALQAGNVPAFAEGGAVDPDAIRDINRTITDLTAQRDIAAQQLKETLANPDADEQSRLRAQISANAAQRDLDSATAQRPYIERGAAVPDTSVQDNIYSTTDSLALAQADLAEMQRRIAAGETVPESERMSTLDSYRQASVARSDAIAASRPKEGEGPASFLDNLTRTQGFTPSGGGGKAGTSSLSGFINMGGEFVNGLIDTGASLIQSAATAAAAAGTAGAGAAAAPAAGAAASYGIQLGAATAKRLVNYGTELAGIGVDSVISQLFPFGGPPRWIGYDYAGMMPQTGIQQAALTTIEQQGQAAINKQFQPGGAAGAVVPELPTAPGSTAAPPSMSANAPYPSAPLSTAPAAPAAQEDPLKRLFGGLFSGGGAVGVYDQGGVLKPGDIAVNKSKTPEAVLTPAQWDAMSTLAASTASGGGAPMVKIDTIYGLSPEDVAKQIEQQQRLAAMRYAGRPY